MRTDLAQVGTKEPARLSIRVTAAAATGFEDMFALRCVALGLRGSLSNIHGSQVGDELPDSPAVQGEGGHRCSRNALRDPPIQRFVGPAALEGARRQAGTDHSAGSIRTVAGSALRTERTRAGRLVFWRRKRSIGRA